MSEDTNLVTDGIASPATPDGNVGENPTGQFNDIHFDMSDDALASYLAKEGVIEEPVVEDEVVSEEPVEDEVQEEELSDNTSDEDVEAEASDETDEEADLEVNEDADIDVLSYDEFFNQVGKIEIDGETYTPAQLKSIAGQVKSAGTKAREAAEALKEANQYKDLVAQYLNDKPQVMEKSAELADLEMKIAQMEQARKEARKEGDMYVVGVIREDLEDAYKERDALRADANRVNQQEEVIAIKRFEKGLEELGFGYLNSKGPQTNAWVQYAQSNLSKEEFQLAVRNPGIAAAIERSRKLEEADSKPVKKVTNTPSPKIKRSGKKVRPEAAQQALQRKMQQGQASPEEIEAYLLAEGRAMFK